MSVLRKKEEKNLRLYLAKDDIPNQFSRSRIDDYRNIFYNSHGRFNMKTVAKEMLCC